MMSRLRLLPILIVVAGIALTARVGGLWSDISAVVVPFGAGQVLAQEAEDEFDEEEEEVLEEASVLPEEEDEEEEELSSGAGDAQFSRAELDLLQNLAARREELDLRARELDIRENLLRAAERRIEEKIVELKAIEGTIESLIEQHDEQEEGKLRSLVSIYESMKPKEAARIFQELDLEILIDVAERMNERKLAPILAQMEPARATVVTVEIRTRKRLPETGG